MASDRTPSARAEVFAPLRVEGAVERIVRRLGEAMGSGLLMPGERLPTEQRLAEQLGVAPMTLRQALAVLRDTGFVETRRGHGGGSFVAADVMERLAAGPARGLEEWRELVDWRRAISGEAAALAAERSDAGLRAAVVEAATGAAEAAGAEFAAYRLADSKFHLAIAEASGSRRLVQGETAIQSELAEVLSRTPGSRSSDALHSSNTGHEPIVAGIAAGDPDAARAATIAHVEATYDWVVGLGIEP